MTFDLEVICPICDEHHIIQTEEKETDEGLMGYMTCPKCMKNLEPNGGGQDNQMDMFEGSE